jgi:hypothetical protein
MQLRALRQRATPQADSLSASMQSPASIDRAGRHRGAALDLVFLAAAIAASTIPYVRRLGFYHDDYHFLGLLATADEQTFGGLLEALRDGVPKQNLRPAQQVLFTGLFDVFGTDPRPWHVLGAVLLVGMGATLYLVLRELLLPRPLAVAVSLLYAVLPHYATARFWPATFAELLSMVLFFVSLYAVLRAVRAHKLRLPAWLLLAVVTLTISVLAYEVAMPLFLLAPALVVYRRARVGGPSLRRCAVVCTPYALALLAVFAWKAAEAREIGKVTGYELGYPDGFAHHLAYLGQGILRVNAGSYGLGLPYVVGWIFGNRLTWAALVLALLIGGAAYAYLARLQRECSGSLPDRSSSAQLFGAGIVIVLLGYAVFLTNSEILFRSAGADNRVAIAAALGVALAAIGGVAWLSARFGGRRAEVVFRGVVATLVAIGVLTVNTLADYWAEASTRQQAVLGDIRSELPQTPANITVILDGTCPEVGPAVVFVSTSDSTGALKASYREPSLEAGVVRDELFFGRTQARITNTFLGSVSSVIEYPYEPQLYVYNGSTRRLYSLGSAADAQRYRDQVHRPPTCPPVRSFAWGIDIQRWRIFA